MARLSIWSRRQPDAERAVELRRAHPDWAIRRIAAELAHDGFTAKTGNPYGDTAVLLLLMLGEHGFPDWLDDKR